MHPLIALVTLSVVQAPADTSYLYRATMLRAAPGRLADVLTLVQRQRPAYDAAGEPRPFVMRHRQGDHWDLLILTPMESFAAYHDAARARPRRAAGLDGSDAALAPLVAWREDLFLLGPPLPAAGPALTGGGLHHIEMFLAVPERREDLFREREMENAYLAALGRPENLLFVRAAGAAWDVVTIGTYRDMAHFGASDTIPAVAEDAAARAAGFDGASQIGFYLRSLLSKHRDTLARAVR